jgi:signal transduction histidine kinase
VDIHYEKTGEAYPVGGSAAIHIYRILQEAMNNMTRHSTAKAARVRLRYLPSRLELEVEDNGTGFKPGTARSGMGLVGMQERAELLGGDLKIGAGQLGGTRVKLSVPRERLENSGG